MYSLQLDYVSNKNASVSGYSKLWGWSRRRVSAFLESVLAGIDSKGKASIGGKIRSMLDEQPANDEKCASHATSSGQVRLIKINGLDTDALQVPGKSRYKSRYKSRCITIDKDKDKEKENNNASTVPEDEFGDLF